MNTRMTTTWLAAVFLPVLASCSGKTAAKDHPGLRDECVEWCESAWEEAPARQVCGDACLEYLHWFQACSAGGMTCAEARTCAAERLNRTCDDLGAYAGECKDSGRFIHHRVMDTCRSDGR